VAESVCVLARRSRWLRRDCSPPRRRILNSAIGPGGWVMIPRGPPALTKDIVFREFALFCYGKFTAQAIGASLAAAAAADGSCWSLTRSASLCVYAMCVCVRWIIGEQQLAERGMTSVTAVEVWRCYNSHEG